MSTYTIDKPEIDGEPEGFEGLSPLFGLEDVGDLARDAKRAADAAYAEVSTPSIGDAIDLGFVALQPEIERPDQSELESNQPAE